METFLKFNINKKRVDNILNDLNYCKEVKFELQFNIKALLNDLSQTLLQVEKTEITNGTYKSNDKSSSIDTTSDESKMCKNFITKQVVDQKDSAMSYNFIKKISTQIKKEDKIINDLIKDIDYMQNQIKHITEKFYVNDDHFKNCLFKKCIFQSSEINDKNLNDVLKDSNETSICSNLLQELRMLEQRSTNEQKEIEQLDSEMKLLMSALNSSQFIINENDSITQCLKVKLKQIESCYMWGLSNLLSSKIWSNQNLQYQITNSWKTYLQQEFCMIFELLNQLQNHTWSYMKEKKDLVNCQQRIRSIHKQLYQSQKMKKSSIHKLCKLEGNEVSVPKNDNGQKVKGKAK